MYHKKGITMTLPTLQQAHHIVADLSEELRKLHISGKESLGHYIRVAQNAHKIALYLPHLNPEKAYIMGLVHDYGQVEEARNKKRFHGLAGYQSLMTMGYDEAARACLVHSFFEWEDITPERYHSYDKDCILQCAKLLKERPFNDYDRLVHLADLTAICHKTTSLEMRFEYLAVTYRINERLIKEKFLMACRLKHYFDELCQQNIYDILGIKSLNNPCE